MCVQGFFTAFVELLQFIKVLFPQRKNRFLFEQICKGPQSKSNADSHSMKPILKIFLNCTLYSTNQFGLLKYFVYKHFDINRKHVYTLITQLLVCLKIQTISCNKTRIANLLGLRNQLFTLVGLIYGLWHSALTIRGRMLSVRTIILCLSKFNFLPCGQASYVLCKV